MAHDVVQKKDRIERPVLLWVGYLGVLSTVIWGTVERTGDWRVGVSIVLACGWTYAMFGLRRK